MDVPIPSQRSDVFKSPTFCALPSYDDFKKSTSVYLSKNLSALQVPAQKSHFDFEIELQDGTRSCTAHTIPEIRANIAPDLRKKPLRTMSVLPGTGAKGKIELLPVFFWVATEKPVVVGHKRRLSLNNVEPIDGAFPEETRYVWETWLGNFGYDPHDDDEDGTAHFHQIGFLTPIVQAGGGESQ